MRGKYSITPANVLMTASVVALSLAAIPSAAAQTWDGSESGDWYDPLNWSTNLVPPDGPYTFIKVPNLSVPTIDGGMASVNTLFLGFATSSGGAQLNIKNGASFTTSGAIIGDESNGAPSVTQYQSGRVTLTGASNWNAGSLTLGLYGDGVIDITEASTVTASSVTLGNLTGPTSPERASGKINISGSGSQLTVTSSSTSIGANGDGEITVENQGKLLTLSAGLGVNAGSTGVVTVTGTGSSWNVSGNVSVSVGGSGNGTLKVLDGATYASGTAALNIGYSASGSGTVEVSGANSTLRAGQAYVGAYGTGTLKAENAAELNLSHIFLGVYAAGASGTMSVSGPDTIVSASGYTIAGYYGAGTVTLSNQGTIRTPSFYLATYADSSGTLNIGAAAGSAAVAPGTLDSTKVSSGAGTGKVVFNHTGTNYTFAPQILGGSTASVLHLAGTTNLTANSSAFAGTTTINGGTLKVLGSLGGATTVNSGGILGGSGTLANVQLNSGSTIAPDGTLTVSGNLNFGTGSTYSVDVGNSTSDLITAQGAVTLAGGAVSLQTAGKSFTREESHKILTGVLTDTFASLSTQSAFLDAVLDYSHTNEVWVNLSRNDMAFADAASTGNQQAIANILGALPTSHPLVAAMLGLSAEQAKEAMNQLSGDTQATLETAGASVAGQVQNVLMNRIRQAFNAIGAQGSAVSNYAPRVGELDVGESPDIAYWLQGLGEYTHVDATASAGGLSAGTAGLLGGADTAFNEWRVGVVGGYTRTGYAAEGRPADGSINNIHAGLYAGAEFDALRLQLNALQTWHGISSRRNVSFGGLSETLTADYGAQTSLLFGEVGYGVDLGTVELEPFASVAYTLGQTNAYSESGGASALSVGASTQQSVTTVLGFRPEMAFAIDDKLLTARGMLGWQHQAGETPTGSYSLAGSAPFTVTGSSLSSDALVYEAGLNLDVNAGLNLDLLYSGRLAPNDFSQGVKGIVAAKF